MLNHSVPRIVGAWFVVLAVTIAASLIFRPTATVATWAPLMLTAFTPPAIALVLRRGVAQTAVAKILSPQSAER